jgi:hypothetical protein
MENIKYWILIVILFLCICIVFSTSKESFKERYDIYSRCYDVTNDYQKALACIEIHKYLQGEK